MFVIRFIVRSWHIMGRRSFSQNRDSSKVKQPFVKSNCLIVWRTKSQHIFLIICAFILFIQHPHKIGTSPPPTPRQPTRDNTQQRRPVELSLTIRTCRQTLFQTQTKGNHRGHWRGTSCRENDGNAFQQNPLSETSA